MTAFDKETQKQLFVASLVLLSGMIVFAVVVFINNIDMFHILPGCIFKEKTGYYCPGCGGTRSVYALLHGHIIESFLWHPIVPYTAGMVLNAAAIGIMGICKKTYCKFLFRPVHFYIWIVLLMGNWIVKNLIIICLF